MIRPPVVNYSIPNPSPLNQVLLYFAIIFFIMFFPFLVVDLYYAYRDDTCVGQFPPGTTIKITLRNWLQVDGYIILAFIIIFLILGIIACSCPASHGIYGTWEGLHVFFIIWRLIWLIVGAVMFWKGYYPNNTCAQRVERYMFALLIIGFIYILIEPLLAFLYPRAVPVIVPVPMTTQLGTHIGTPTYSPAVTSTSALIAPQPQMYRPPRGYEY